MRLDMLLNSRGDYPSRNRAAEAIKRGAVSVNGEVIYRPAHTPGESDIINCDAPTNYVSRAAHKLKAGLSHFNYAVGDKILLDIGASTGGFTEVLLEAGAAHIYALDVGQGQLAAALRDNPRITSLENTNARNISADMFSPAPQAIVCDVSFISLKLATPPALQLITDGWIIALIKPQFEVGKAVVDETKGVVRDPSLHKRVCDDIYKWFTQQGWACDEIIESPVVGTKGNKEFLIGARKI